ncbi:S8 family serine peptidase [Pelagicoccus sp. SDUM812003]|nr:S8 family serine peptidase [Pelagicoccus sp. SDUM812003]
MDWSKSRILEERFSAAETKDAALIIRTRIVFDDTLGLPIELEELVSTATPSSKVEKLISSHVANQVLISFEKDVSEKDLQNIAEAISWEVHSYSPESSLAVLQTDETGIGTTDKAISALAEFRDLITAEANPIVYALTNPPNDQRYQADDQWGLGPKSEFGINASEGWSLRTNTDNAVIAIIDTGLRLDHEDLAANLWTNVSEIPNNGRDDDNNGYIDDIHGINAITNSGDPSDDNGHGTHVSGIAGAVGDNGIGIAGVAWSTRLMAIKALNSDGRGTTADMIRALDYAGLSGASVVNASWGSDKRSSALEQAIQRLRSKGIVLVAAAGNDGVDISEVGNRVYPACFDLDNIITVAASSKTGGQTFQSNWGRAVVDIAAPGFGIVSTWHTASNAYTSNSGTSMAAPYVSGMIALAAAEYPTASPSELIDRICLTAHRNRNLALAAKFSGIPDLYACLATRELPRGPILYSSTDATSVRFAGESTSFEVEADSDTEVSYQWLLDRVEIAGQTTPILSLNDLTIQDEGEYTLIATNEEGASEIAFFLDILEVDAELEAAADASANIDILTTNETPWQVIEDPESKGGTAIGFPSNRTNAYSQLFLSFQGPATLRFKWFVDQSFYNFWLNAETTSRSPRLYDEWHYMEVDFPEAKEYKIDWAIKPESRYAWPRPILGKIDDVNAYPFQQTPPLILKQPTGTRGTDDHWHTLAVEAIGNDISYQWYQNGEPVPDATEPQLNLGYLDSSKAGDYYVIASSPYGSEQSETARVQFIDTADYPEFDNPNDIRVDANEGDSTTLSFPITGAEPMLYQWYKYDNAIPGATQRTLTLAPARMAHGGEYRLRISNSLNPNGILSPELWLTVHPSKPFPPKFDGSIDRLETTVFSVGEELQIGVGSPGVGDFDYQWFKDGLPIEGANELELGLDSVSLEDAGVYYLEARNSVGVSQSHRIQVFVTGVYNEALDNSELEFISQSALLTTDPDEAFDGEDAVRLIDAHFLQWPAPSYSSWMGGSGLKTTLTGPVNLSFRWKQSIGSTSDLWVKLDSEIIAYAEASGEWEQLIVHVPAGSHTLNWVHQATHADQQAWLDTIALTDKPAFSHVSKPLTLVSQPTTTLYAEAKGSGTFSYQWFKNGANLPGETAASLVLDSSKINENDRYHAEVSSEFGTIATEKIALVHPSKLYALAPPDLEIDAESSWGIKQDREPGASGDFRALKLTLPPQQAATLSFTTSQASTLGLKGYFVQNLVIKAFLDGNELEVLKPSSPQSDFPLAVHIPAAGDFKIVFENPDDQYDEDLEISDFVNTDAPFIARSPDLDYLTQGNSSEQELRFLSTPNSTVRWYREDQLLFSEELSNYFISRPEFDPSLVEGTVYCEIEDSYGNITRSEDIHYRPRLTGLELLDLADSDYSFEGVSISYDNEQKQAGDYSIRVPITPATEKATLQISPPYSPDPKPYSVFLKSNSPHLEIYSTDLLGSRRKLAVGADWTEVVMLVDSRSPWNYAFEIENPQGTEASLWADNIKPYEKLLIAKQPKNFASFIGGPAWFSVDVYPQEGVEIQWYRNGTPIAGANASQIELDSVSFEDLGSYTVRATLDGASLQSEAAELSLAEPMGFAVNQPGIKIATWGDAFWHVDRAMSYDDTHSLVSGDIGDGESSGIRFYFDGVAMGHAFSYYQFSGDDPYNSWQSGRFYTDLENPYIEYKVEIPLRIDQYQSALVKTWVDQISVQPLPMTSYRDWVVNLEASRTVSTELSPISDPQADTDGDGLINLFEFALNLDPYRASSPPTIQTSWLDETLVGEIEYEAITHPDYHIAIEVSDDMQEWYPVAATIESTPSSNSPYNSIRARFELNTTNEAPQFWRWSIYGTQTANSPVAPLYSTTEK